MELTKEQWHDVRFALRLIIRKKHNAKKDKMINDAMEMIKDPVDRDIFTKYYLEGWGIIKITMNMYYSKSAVIHRNNRATKQFVENYYDGYLLRMFEE